MEGAVGLKKQIRLAIDAPVSPLQGKNGIHAVMDQSTIWTILFKQSYNGF